MQLIYVVFGEIIRKKNYLMFGETSIDVKMETLAMFINLDMFFIVHGVDSPCSCETPVTDRFTGLKLERWFPTDCASYHI